MRFVCNPLNPRREEILLRVQSDVSGKDKDKDNMNMDTNKDKDKDKDMDKDKDTDQDQDKNCILKVDTVQKLSRHKKSHMNV